MGVAACLAAVVAWPASAHATRMGSPRIAALQVALEARGLYDGTIDGFRGSGTGSAVRAFQRRAGLAVDGVPGPQTLHALGRHGRHALGSRVLRRGRIGFDVAELQFLLAWHGFPCATIDGGFGSHTEAALLRFQHWAGLHADGAAGSLTIRALSARPRPSPVSLALPIHASVGDPFGPRGNHFHPGIDFPAPTGTPVYAARSGRVTWASWRPGGYGDLVSIAHGGGLRTLYAHLSEILVARGARVTTGTLIGRVGATGLATGPHLHFEVRLRGAAVDPATGL
jgi:murein DD-endopeptidase MepM/ murein hydrolase activator NlpD